MRTRLFILTSLAVTMLTAQEEPGVTAPAVLPPEPAPAAVETAVVPEPLSASKNRDTLSVDFPDEEIRTILRNVADLFELNLVVPDSLQGRTSLKLREVTWRQIYQVVLSPVGYTFVEDGNIIKIVSQETLTTEPLTTEIFIINYAKADEIRKSVEAIVDAAIGGKVIVDGRSNGLVITERPSRLSRIRPIVEKLDRATEQVMIESKFIEVSALNSRNLGLDWTAAGGITLGASQTERGGNNTISPPTFTDSTSYATAVLSSVELASTLNFLQTKGGSRIVSNPTVVTLNNTEAFINVGKEYPIPSYTYNSERGAFEISGFEYKPIGVILKVTPQINSQSFVRLTVEPEISSSTEAVEFGGGGGSSAQIPIIETRKTRTQVSLKDGHTLAIGGLLSDQIIEEQTKLPFLGSIPGVGRLFRNDTKSVDRRNLLIFITAKVVSAEAASVEDIFDPRQIRDAQLKRSDISGFRDGSDPFIPETAPEGSILK